MVAHSFEIVRTVSELRARTDGWRNSGARLALVPTMGAIHQGHLALVEAAKADGGRVLASLFVNPKQFGAGEDLSTYPRDEGADAALLAKAGCDLLYAPGDDEIYGAGFNTTVSVGGPATADLEGVFRRGHFEGVATVVAKLFAQAMPNDAYFGEKDYQQLLVVRRLVRDLDLTVRIQAVETVREPDGLAISSRNAHLTPEERRIAPALHDSLETIAPAPTPERIAAAPAEIVRAGFDKVEYFALRDAETFAPVETVASPARLLAAAWIGRTRLIDNVAVSP